MEIKTRVPGMIVDVKVNEGDHVDVKDVLMVMEAMKMEQPIPSPVAGEVVELRVQKGDRVRSGDVLAVVE
ncbi:biotin/lipoyl-containing protein [Pseudoflavonifractor phocaeensis]|uniref:biotin/lipoyl-containing protein n=1 Tax=Pseudoflavonifractor phocaeensis TaxID=1870988 RepID=UPI00195B5F56|nr:biotin/lipoyl-containing protein [Pseudoflavonifractor phocaeensis]MBM6724720.1 biotin/lipoyl-binding protein [Pseudoflavonifractor phocaeensis]